MSLLCLSLQLNTGFVRASYNDDYPSSGEFKLHHTNGDINAIQLDANIDLRVTGLLAEFTLTQTFKNTTDEWVEGSYLFPLHEESAIQGLIMTIGDREIIGQIMPKAEAESVYIKAKEAGEIASLVEQQRPNLFTMKASSIAPNDEVTVHLSVVLPVEVNDKKHVLRLPTTLTPRYTNALAENADQLKSPFATQAMIRGPRININATIEPLEDTSSVSSQTHHLTLTQNGFSLNDVPMDSDIIVQWPLSATDVASSQAYVSTHNGERYVQIMLTPPEKITAETTIARELVLLIDKSGSMAGVSINAAREALHFALDGLSASDTFNIVAFDHDHYPLFQHAQPATGQALLSARRFIDNLDADGGTEMQSALDFALQKSIRDTQDSDEISRLRQVVFLTDGSVGYEDALLKSIERQLGKSRLFTIGIGPAPNAWFIKKAGEVGRGTSLEIQNSFDVAEAVNKLLGILQSPALTDISIQYAQGHGEIYPNPLPDLYVDKPGLWVAKISNDVSEIIITGNQNGKRTRQTLTLPPPDELYRGSSAAPVAMHWARQKVSSLLDQQRYSHDQELHKDLITKIGVEVGLVTPYTSFVAVDKTPAVTTPMPTSEHKVANLIPTGNQMMSTYMPQGSAGADTWLWLSLLFGFSGLCLLFIPHFNVARSPECNPA
ncbi:MAG: marine proteobacterial sortase target protein [Granulosicoccus sp.]